MKSDFDSIDEMLDYIIEKQYTEKDIIYDNSAVYCPDHNEPKIVRNAFFCENPKAKYELLIHNMMLWNTFLKEAEPEREFADTSEDNKRAIIKAMDAAYSLGFNDAKR
jgi:hypothetical protein